MTTVHTKPLAWFRINTQVRKSFSEQGLLPLGDSLKVKQLQPVLAQPDGTLIAGERRYRAALLVGLATLEVKIADEQLTGSQVRLWQLTENMQRADLTGFEKWQGCKEVLELNDGWNQKELAAHLHLSESMIVRLLSPSRCTVAWQEALRDGAVGVSDCYAASKLPETDQAELLALKLSGASRDQIEQAGRKTRKGNVPVVRVCRIKCPMSNAIVQISGEGISLDDAIEVAQEWVKEAKKASEQGLDSKTFERVCKDKAKKG
jgi:ParB family chromosome partitioning protein